MKKEQNQRGARDQLKNFLLQYTKLGTLLLQSDKSIKTSGTARHLWAEFTGRNWDQWPLGLLQMDTWKQVQKERATHTNTNSIYLKMYFSTQLLLQILLLLPFIFTSLSKINWMYIIITDWGETSQNFLKYTHTQTHTRQQIRPDMNPKDSYCPLNQIRKCLVGVEGIHFGLAASLVMPLLPPLEKYTLQSALFDTCVLIRIKWDAFP